MIERPAYLFMSNRMGQLKQPVIVIGETKKLYRIVCSEGAAKIRLAGLYRYLVPGKTALVPKAAISFLKGKK